MGCDMPHPEGADFLGEAEDKQAFALLESKEASADDAIEAAGEAHAPMIIHRASIELVVDDPAALSESTRALVADLGGFVEHSDSHGSEGQLEVVDLTVRVPARELEATLHALHEQGTVTHESLGGQDVTRAHRDRQATISNKRAFEARMVDLLQQSGSVEDALRIEEQLQRIRTEIDMLQSQIEATEHDVAMATLEVHLRDDDLPESGSVLSILGEASDDARTAFIAVIGALIRLLGATLPLLALGFLGFLGIRPIVRRRRREAAALARAHAARTQAHHT
jgi:hypothetical protein